MAVDAVEALAALTVTAPGIDGIKDSTPVADIAMALSPNARMPEDERITAPVAILDDVEVLPGDWELFRALTAACDPPGANRGMSADLRRPLYSFVRTNAPRDPMHHWDSDDRLQLVITLSRLVRPTSIGFLYATRLIGQFGSSRYKLIPGPVRGFGAHAWVADPARDWLSRTDLDRLRELAHVFFAEPFAPKSRLQSALWYFEYAARTQLVDAPLHEADPCCRREPWCGLQSRRCTAHVGTSKCHQPWIEAGRIECRRHRSFFPRGRSPSGSLRTRGHRQGLSQAVRIEGVDRRSLPRRTAASEEREVTAMRSRC
jgi:hypothetical protein